MKGEEILFYVLVPVYKTELYLRECIDSVLKQTYQNYKLIIVDDGSPDRSGIICDEYADKYPQIVVIHKENQGLLAARQTALDWVKNDLRSSDQREDTYIVFLDSDDTLKLYALEQISEAIRKQSCDMVIYGYDRVWEGRITKKYDAANAYKGVVEDKRLLYRIVFSDPKYNSLCRKAVAVSLISDMDYTPYYGIIRGEDLFRSLEYLGSCRRVCFLNESLYNYTENPNSIQHLDKPEFCDISFQVRNRVHEFLKSENVFTQKDWDVYRAYCIEAVNVLVNRILRLEISAAEKKKLLQSVRESEYYQNYISGKKYERKELSLVHRIAHNLFAMKMDGLLIGARAVYGRIKSLIRRR